MYFSGIKFLYVFLAHLLGPLVSKYVFSEMFDLLPMFREVLQFCTEISFGMIFEVKWAPFRLQMEVVLETFGWFWELWGGVILGAVF